MRVLVTADSSAARRELLAVLNSLGYEALDPTELGAGALLASSPWEVDAVVAGLFAARPSAQQRSAVRIELGIALGRNLPLLVIGRYGAQTAALTGVPRIEANLADLETLGLKLDLFLQGVRAGAPSESTARYLKPQTRKPTAAINRLASELESEVAALLMQSGSTLLTEKGVSDSSRHDLAFYLEGPDSKLGLILVDVKQFGSMDWKRRLREAVNQLGENVARTNAGFGLVVYDGDELPSRVRVTQPLVAAISLFELGTELEQRSLAELLRLLRNEAIHGL